MDCQFCLQETAIQKLRFKNELVAFIQDRRHQGALKHSGVIIPLDHKETLFDLSEAEIVATFRLLAEVKQWLDATCAPDGYNIG
jgi:diadenosine tetraphosphate (Ap4A) HIT family hydrolase